MNKRLMEFLHELTEENDRLQMRSNAASHDNVMLRQENERQKQEIKELKAKLRQIKKTLGKWEEAVVKECFTTEEEAE